YNSFRRALHRELRLCIPGPRLNGKVVLAGKKVREAVFAQIVRLRLRLHILRVTSSRAFDGEKLHLSTAYSFSAFIAHPAIDHRLRTQAKDHVLGVLAVSGRYSC